MTKRLIALAPWLIASAIVIGLLLSVDLGEVADAFAQTDYVSLTLVLAVFCFSLFLWDSVSWMLLFRRLVSPLPFRQLLELRAFGYVLGTVHFGAAVGGVTLLASRIAKLRALPVAGAFLWLTALDFTVIVAVLSFGWLLAGDLLTPGVAAALPYFLAAGWAVILGAGLYWYAGFDFLLLGRFRSWRIFEAFARSTLRDVALLGAFRLVFVAIYVLFDWAVLPPCDIHVPLSAMSVYSPLIAVVYLIPGTISGLGALQPVMIELYSPFVGPGVTAPAAHVFAATTAIGLGTNAVRVILGYLFLGGLTKDLRRRRDD